MSAPLDPGSTLGVLGGGQLGRMFAQEALRMGYRVAVYCPEQDPPAGQVAQHVVCAPYEDLDAVERFARGVDVVTFEFENVPAPTVEAAARHAPVRPSGALLHATQQRAREKSALVELGLPVAEHVLVEREADLSRVPAVGFPGVLKTAAFGYDGKGQARVDDAAALPRAWQAIGRQGAVYEALVPFVEELSIVGARGLDGTCALYAPFLNRHAHHILDVTSFPAPVGEATAAQAASIARTILEGFEVVGVLCVELFLLADGRLVVNEVAPRPHNSGHVTLDAHVTSQFEQQVRAVCGLPLGSTAPVAPAGAMANLLGDLWRDGEPAWSRALADDGIRLHLYGKRSARPGRKMGHLSVAAATREEAERRVRDARAALGAGS